MSESAPPGDMPTPWGSGSHAAPPTYVPPPAAPAPTYAPTSHAAPGTAEAPITVPDFARSQKVNRGPAYGGFWRRFWARMITGLAIGLAWSIGLWVIIFATRFLYQNTASCEITTTSLEFCEGEDAVLIGGGVAAVLYALLLYYWTYSRSLATHGGTIGMRQMGLSIRRADDLGSVSKRRAFRRTFAWMFPLLGGSLSGLVILFDVDFDTIFVYLIIEAVVLGMFLLGGLWMLVNERRQTLWDILADTVVVEEREPSWLALVALLIGCLVPWAASLGLSIAGTGSLRSHYDDVAAGRVDTGTVIRWFLPLAVVAVGAVLFGHLGLRDTRWSTPNPAGRGLALTGAFLGYVVPVLVGLLVLVTFTVDRLDSLNEKDCNSVRREIVKAAQAYRDLNGRYPVSLGNLSDTAYLGETPDSALWRYEVDPADPAGYRLNGLESCAK